jgi:hypothetical protein
MQRAKYELPATLARVVLKRRIVIPIFFDRRFARVINSSMPFRRWRDICVSKQKHCPQLRAVHGIVLLISTLFLCHSASAQSWIQLSPAGAPPSARGMNGSPGVYDSTNDRMIMFGGQDSSGNNLNDVWVLENATRVGGRPQWVNLIPNGAAGSPPARSGHSTVYDSADNRLIIFGGCSASCAPVLNDVWVLTNANGLGGTPVWTEVSPGGGPAPRTNSAVAYNPAENELIVFGGQDGSANPCSTFSDIWLLYNANGLRGSGLWISATTPEPPPAGQNGAASAYASGVLTLFGGLGMVNGTCTATNEISQLIEITGTSFFIVGQSNPEGATPSPRAFASIASDSINGRMLMYGGTDASGDYLNDIWSFFGAWSQITPKDTPPPARRGETAILDSVNQRMTIFGGDSGSGVLDDTWIMTVPELSELSCVATGGNPAIVRGEGITEQVGDLVLNCTGGTPTPPGEPIPEYWITLTLNTDITSRSLPEALGLSSPLLVIDEAFPANPVPSYAQPVSNAPPQILCTPLGATCEETGTGGTPSPYQTQPNTFVGKQSSAPTVYWKVPIDPRSDTLARIIRLTNVRANASQLGIAPCCIPNSITATVELQGSDPPPVASPQQIVAFNVQALVPGGMSSASILQCEPHNAALLGGSGTAAFDFNVPISEGFGAAFKARNEGAYLYGPVFPPVLEEQNVFGFPYWAETGFYSPGLFTGAPTLGLADFGTRILVSLGSVVTGTHLFVPTSIITSSGIGQLQLVQAESNGASAPGYEPIAPTATIGTTPVAEASRSFSTAYAVYEVIDANPSIIESATIPVAVAFTNKPATGAVMATTTLAPLGTVEAANELSPIPRFVSLSTPQQAYSINSCPAP